MRKSLLHLKYPFVQAKKTKRAEGGGEYVGVPWYLAFLKGLRLFVFSTRYNNLRPFKSKMWVTVFDNGQQPARAGTNWNKLFFLSWNLAFFENLLSFKNVFLRLDIFIV